MTIFQTGPVAYLPISFDTHRPMLFRNKHVYPCRKFKKINKNNVREDDIS
jgi:hypothetical protein